MPFHKALYELLPPADEIRKSHEPSLKIMKDADGFYALVQDIAAKYGDRAYGLAEEAFQQLGLEYDPAELRTAGKIRRVGYAFDGPNIYDVTVRVFEPAMTAGVVRVYRNVIRNLSREALMDQESFTKSILADPACDPEGLLVATGLDGAALGFVHCWTDGKGAGSLELLAFYPGLMHAHVGTVLIEQARRYFSAKRVTRIEPFGGKLKYPFYTRSMDFRSGFKQQLGYIDRALQALARAGMC